MTGVNIVTKKIVISTILSAVVMFGIAGISLMPKEAINAAFFWSIILIFVINPLFMVFIGIFNGAQFNKLWFVPIIPAAMFVAAICVFQTFSWDSLIYPLGYLAIGEIAALLTFLVKKQKLKNKGKDNG